MKELTKAEEQVMQVIWKIGQGFANEIMAAYPEPKPAYNTVLTMVRILEKLTDAGKDIPKFLQKRWHRGLIGGLLGAAVGITGAWIWQNT